jgi:hypothetical protein
MIRKILIHSYLQLINNSKITKVVLFSLFAHSLIAVFVIVFNAYLYAEKQFNLNSSNEVIQYVMNLFEFDNIWRVTLGLGVFLFLWYFVFSPIGEYTIVHYLSTDWKLSNSLKTSFNNFHHIAKYDGMTFMFSIMLFIRFLSEAYLYEVNNGIVMVLFFIWFIMVALVTVFFQYTKTIIVLEGLPVFESIKKSISVTIDHLRVTLKLVWISLIFNLRMIFNVVFIIWIPLAAIVLLQALGAVGWVTDIVVYILFFWLFFFLAYINTLIEGYFRIFWYISYEYIMGNTEQLERLGIIKPKDMLVGWLFDWSHGHEHDIDEMKLLESS